MPKFRKKPVVIEAFQLTKRNNGPDPFPEWFDEAVTRNAIITHGMGKFGEGAVFCEIHTLEGTMRASEGDFIIKGIKGEFYPCKPDIFAALYEPAE